MRNRTPFLAPFLSIVALTLPLQAQESDDAVQAEAPSHQEVEPLRIELGDGGKIVTMAMDREGRLLLAVSWLKDSGGEESSAEASQPARNEGLGPPRRGFGQPGQGNRRAFGQRQGAGNRGAGRRVSPFDDPGNRDHAIKVVDPASGEIVRTWPMDDVAPKMLQCCDDGQIYVFGDGKIMRFDSAGKQLQALSFADVLGGDYAAAHASGITANDEYLFLAFGNGRSTRATEDIVRFNRDLSAPDPVVIVEQQFGCCAHIDLDIDDDVLLIAENSRHRVNQFDFDGNPVGRWGQRHRTDIAGFAACCNPVNFDFGPDEELFTAESGIGRVKRYSPQGDYLGLVGYVDTTKFDRGSRLASQSCYIPVEVSADGSRVYVMDVRAHIVRVLAANDSL